MKIVAENIKKIYDGKDVLQNISFSAESGGRYLITGASGEGKTTLLRIIMGLEMPDVGSLSVDDISVKTDTGKNDAGKIDTGKMDAGKIDTGTEDVKKKHKEYLTALKKLSIGTAFQEDRLCENVDAITNVRIVNKGFSEEEAVRELSVLFDENDLRKPVSTLSGGMCRRVSIVRACAASRNIYIFDEPFSGLDKDNAKKTAEYIREKTKGGILFLTTHIEEYNEIFGGFEIIKL